MDAPPPPKNENSNEGMNPQGEKKYYYSDGRQQYGPHTIAELMARGVRPDTLVWHKDLDDWYPARRLPELHELFQQMGGNMGVNRGMGMGGNTGGPPPKNWMVEAILATILCCLPFGIVSIVYASSVESKWFAGRAQEAEVAAKNAKGWAMASFFTALGFWVIYFLFFLVLGSAGAFR